jgi:hypothetical protein
MLQHLRLFSLSQTHVLIKVGVLAILLTCSVKVLAGCRADKAAGWEMFAICAANFDSTGQYVDSSCHDAGPPSGSESTLNMCMGAPAVGGCTGSLCTWDGPLSE